MALNLAQTSLPHLGSGRIGARVFEDRFPIFRREGRIRSRSGGAPLADGFSGQFFHLLGVGMRQLADRSVIPN